MKHRMRIITISAIVVLAGAGIFINRSCTQSAGVGLASEPLPKTGKEKGKGDRVVPVDVFVADYALIEEGVRSVGSLLPFEEVNISSEIAGKVDKVNFEDGDMLKQGHLMVKINDEDLQAQLKKAIYQRNMIKERLERNRVLLQKDAISREAFDQIETDYNVIEADIQILQVKIEKTEIRAPFTGMVGFRTVSLGTYLQAGTQIARLVDFSKLRLEFAIPEKYSQLASRGRPVYFTSSESTQIRTASVYAVDPRVDVNTRTVSLRALYDNKGYELRPGMFAAVTIGQRRGSTIQIPTQAIVPENNGKKVWVLRKGRAVSSPVTTGVRGETMIEVTSGVSKGDTIVISGLLQVKEGSKVLINK